MSVQVASLASAPPASQMMLVPIYCMVSAEQVPNDVFAASTADEAAALGEDAQSSVSSWDDDLCSFLWTAYNFPKDWTKVEQGLHLRAKALPCFESVFVEEAETGDYRRWGTLPNDWLPVATHLKRSFVIVDAANWTLSFADPSDNGGERGGETAEIKARGAILPAFRKAFVASL